MLIRFSIHLPVVVILLLIFADAFNWVDMKSPVQIAVSILLVLGVYAGAFAAAFYQDRKTADKLNDGLKRRYHS